MNIKPMSECAFDQISLGEVMLRLDPGQGRIKTPLMHGKAAVSTTLPEDCAVVSAYELQLLPPLLKTILVV